MGREQVTIQVIGLLWMPMCDAAAEFTPTLADDPDADYGIAGELERFSHDAIEDWIGVNTGDFSAVVDWRAEVTTRHESCAGCGQTIPETEALEWSDPDSEFRFIDSMYGSEEEYSS